MVDSMDVKKTTTLSQIDKQGDSGRRLVEYFVVISSIELHPEDLKTSQKDDKNVDFSDWKTESANYENEEEFSHYVFRPKITARYPLHDHADNPLHENVTFFCHPSGGIKLRTEEYLPKVHFFVATGGTGRQVYGTCFTLWEPYKLRVRHKDGEAAGKASEEERQVFIPKCLVILSTYPYLTAFREYLTQLNRLARTGEMTLPIERYIANFCSEVPAPPPGSVEVQTTILDSVIKIWSLPHNLPIPWVSLPFAPLFECLDISNIILVWHCLVLERQVLITSTQISLLGMASEIFLSLMFPMRWSHAYIPVLPSFMIPILSAPMPFLCGINKKNLADALYDLSRDCVLVDLDKNTVTLGPDTTPLPSLPPAQDAALRGQLEDNVGLIFREARSLTRNDDYSESGTHLPMHVKLMADAMWESKLCLYDEAFHLFFTPEEARKNHLNGNDASGMESEKDITPAYSIFSGHNDKDGGRQQSPWDAVQEAFVDTFVYLLRNYRKYLVFPSKHNEGSYGGAGFRSKEFIDSQRYDMRAFLEQLIGTQMFDNFITKRLYGSGEADVAFFDNAVDKFLKNAGMFADVDFSGRIMSAYGSSSTEGKKGNSAASNSSSKARPKRTPSGSRQSGHQPLIQSAKVHRKLKTIVPPEPTGEGLPDDLASEFASSTSIDDTDDTSVQSSNSSRRYPTNTVSSLKSASSKKKQVTTTYKYETFPSRFRAELFGTPRPLPAAVIAEFDRQRRDASSQFRRKGGKSSQGSKPHIQRARATVDPDVKPSPEVATFTVFFMAFSAIVGKELVDMANDPKFQEQRTILSTYVPTGGAIDVDEGLTTDDDDEETVDEVDPEEQEGVEAMKASRPSMGGMFDDDDQAANSREQPAPKARAKTNTNGKSASSSNGTSKVDSDGFEVRQAKTNDSRSDTASTNSNSKTSKTDDKKPRQRFRDKLSDLQIEEAKATGRGQLGLAFEMLTMMKKRGLRADPEAYQCLIDACGRVGDTKRATELLGKMHEDGIVADGTVYACLVSAFSAESAWKDSTKQEELPEWANSTAVEMDWNKLQKKSLIDTLLDHVVELDEDEDDENENASTYQKLRKRLLASREGKSSKGPTHKSEDRMEFFVTEAVERQIELGENLLEIVFPDISVDTENEVCPRCNFVLTDDDVVAGWKPGDSNDYTTTCPNCTQRYVPHFCVQCSSQTFLGSRGVGSPLMCERLSPWVLQKEIRSVMAEADGMDNLLSPQWREQELKNAVLWWNLVLSCMRYRFPFSFLLQGSFEQNLIAPLPEDET